MSCVSTGSRRKAAVPQAPAAGPMGWPSKASQIAGRSPGAASVCRRPSSSTDRIEAVTSGAMRSTSWHTSAIRSGRGSSLTRPSSTRFCSTSCILVSVMSVRMVMVPPGPPEVSSEVLIIIDTQRGWPDLPYSSVSM